MAEGDVRTVRSEPIREFAVCRPDGRADVIEDVLLHQAIGTWGGGEDSLPPVRVLRVRSTKREVVANDDGTFIDIVAGTVFRPA